MILIRSLRPYWQALGLHGALVLVGALLLGLLGAPHQIRHYLAGSLLAALNVVVMVWTVNRLLAKKPIALTVTVSVFKYGFLIAFLWLVTQTRIAIGFGFFVGLLMMLPSLAIIIFLINKRGKEWFISTGHN